MARKKATILRTSVMSGTPFSTTGSRVSKVAQSTGSTAFLFAEGTMRPASGVPPWTMRCDMERGAVVEIVQHQTSELWMKLMLHELAAAMAAVGHDQLGSAFKMMARVSRIMEQLVHAWDVLATMTPPEYSAIRPYLSNSSGFQSWQYRCVEFMLGNKNATMLKPHAHKPETLARVEAA